MGWWLGLAPATLEFWVQFPNERNQGKQAHPVLKYRVPHGSQPRPGWAPDPLMVGIRSPDGLVVGSCTSHPGVLGSIPKREEPGKTGAPCIKVQGSSRVPGFSRMSRRRRQVRPGGHTSAVGSWGRRAPFSTDTVSYTHTARSLACPLLTLSSARPFSNCIFRSNGAPASLSSVYASFTYARRMDGFCNQNADQLGSLAGLSLLTVYVGVVECASASLPPVSSSLTYARRMDGFCNQNADQLGSLAGLSLLTVYVGVVECATSSLPPSSSSLTHALRMDGFCNQNADQLGSLAGLSLLTVYVGVVECAPASPYAYSSSTHRFPDECTPIEATPLSATSAELGLGLGLGFGIGFTFTLLLARAPLLLATLLSYTSLFPRVH
jgi:hypothetical protein